jgi:hypothetical protein
MTPLAEEPTTLVLSNEAQLLNSTSPIKPLEAEQDEESTVASSGSDPVSEEEQDGAFYDTIAGTPNFCTDLFGVLTGKNKTCSHCQEEVLYSEERVKERQDKEKIYFHMECDKLRKEMAQVKSNRSEVFQEIEKYWTARQAAEAHRTRVNVEMKEYFSSREMQKSPPETPQKKKGFFSRIFGGCRNNNAVAV